MAYAKLVQVVADHSGSSFYSRKDECAGGPVLVARPPTRVVPTSCSDKGDFPFVDLFVISLTKKLQIYCSRERDPGGYATDSLSISWMGLDGYPP